MENPTRILVVDDDAQTTRSLRLLLERSGFTVRIENDPTQVLRAVAAFEPHVVILDYDMPVLDGSEVAWQIHRDPALRLTRMILCTGHPPLEIASRLPPVRIPIIGKPVDLEALLRFLRSSVPLEDLAEAAVASPEVSVLAADQREWLWCGRCARCFRKGDLSAGDLLSGCAYADCDGKLIYHGWLWTAVRLRHPDYPETPERDACYAGPIPNHTPAVGPCAKARGS